MYAVLYSILYITLYYIYNVQYNIAQTMALYAMRREGCRDEFYKHGSQAAEADGQYIWY